MDTSWDTEKYVISTPFWDDQKRIFFKNTENSTCTYCRLWICRASSEEVECLPLTLTTTFAFGKIIRMLRPCPSYLTKTI